MNPPPPMFPALGCVTDSANAVATAASTAFPPLARIDAPMSDAGADTETTSPDFETTASSLPWAARGGARTANIPRTVACRSAREASVSMGGGSGAMGEGAVPCRGTNNARGGHGILVPSRR